MRQGALRDTPRAEIEDAVENLTIHETRKALTDEQKLAIKDLGRTYETLKRLHKEGRDTIWSYIARNLSRPLFFAADAGWANVVVGNPPWVAYRHMSDDLQKRFRSIAKGLRLFVGGKFATQNDLAALFTVRAAQLYLRPGSRIAFVLPLAALTRGQFEPLRRGSFPSSCIAWDAAWTMDERVVPLFPVPSCVLFGRKRAVSAHTPERVRAYSGWLPLRDASEEIADRGLVAEENAAAPQEGKFADGSVYRDRFRQGASLVPRMLCFIDRKTMGRVGPDPDAPFVVSRRSANEKSPWKELEAIEGQVEASFLRPAILGENILPYRVMSAFEVVIPVNPKQDRVLTSESARLKEYGYYKLADWLARAESVWNEHRAEGNNLTFSEQLDFFGKLLRQFPIPKLRVVYAKAGTQPAATLLRDKKAIVDHKLYWTKPVSEDEAYYLTSLLNSETIRYAAERYQSRGQFGARDFDKVAFNLPIPKFSAAAPLHLALADAGRRAEAAAALVPLPEGEGFVRLRGRVRAALRTDGVAGEIDGLVTRLLGLDPTLTAAAPPASVAAEKEASA